MREILAFTKEEGRDIAVELSERIVQFYKERPDSIALIPKKDKSGKVVYTPEITRPLALMLWQYLVRYVSGKGGSLMVDTQVLYADKDRVVIKATALLEIGGQKFQFAEVGEAMAEDEMDDTVARKAYTRAFKRLMEQVIGEDFINRTILKLVGFSEEQNKTERPATEKQLEIIKDFIKKGRLTTAHVEELIEEGRLPQGFDLNKALEEGTLTDSQASLLLEKAGLVRRKP